MRGSKKVKRGIVFVLLFLMAGFVFQPSKAAEMQCGIWCPGCAKWQENFVGEVPDSATGKGQKEITVSCKECGRNLIKATKWVDTATYNSGTDDESSSWWTQYTMNRCSTEVVFPRAEAYSEGGSDSDDSYRVVADGDVFGATGYGWTTQAIYDEAEAYLSPLFNSLYNCADGDFTWEDWYNCGLSTNASGVKNSPLISYMNKFGIKAVLQEELTPPVLSVTGDANVQIYRAGVLVEGALADGDLQAGDVVEIIPVKVSGRAYADYSISDNASNVNWQEETQVLSFTMPAGEVTVEIGYWELQKLNVSLAPLFYETYQKEPYWDGSSFNLDCEPPITVENGMLTVNATLQHSRTLEMQEREVAGFTITGGKEIVNLGENAITVTADVLGDGYILEGSCIIRADSVALKELMKETESETYTELKLFVESLMDKLVSYEQVIDELSKNLEISEEQRAESERKLSEALEEIALLTEKLEEKKEQIGEMSAEIELLTEELESVTSQLADMRETLLSMQEFLQEITGTGEIDKELLEKAKEEFEELKNQKESLVTELEKLTERNQSLSEKNQSLLERNESLTEKNENLAERNESLLEKLEKLSEENEILQNRLERVMTDNTEMTEQLERTLLERNSIRTEYEHLKNDYAVLNGQYATLKEQNNTLGEQIAALLQKNTNLTEEYKVSDAEKQEWQKKYELLLAEQTLEKNEIKKEETERMEVELTEVTTKAETATKAEVTTKTEAATKADMPTKVEQMVTKETLTSTQPPTTEASTTMLMTTEGNQKEEADYQSAGLSSGRKLLPGIATVIVAMLLGGVVLYFALEQKELPFKIENLKNLG